MAWNESHRPQPRLHLTRRLHSYINSGHQVPLRRWAEFGVSSETGAELPLWINSQKPASYQNGNAAGGDRWKTVNISWFYFYFFLFKVHLLCKDPLKHMYIHIWCFLKKFWCIAIAIVSMQQFLLVFFIFGQNTTWWKPWKFLTNLQILLKTSF